MGEATKAALWGRRLLAELEGKWEQAVPLLLGDNKGAVQLTRGVSNTSKIKHSSPTLTKQADVWPW
jgi:hypothetical protein